MRAIFWDDVTAWPSLSAAATMLGVHKTTVSRHVQRGRIASRAMGLGKGKRVVPPVEVLRLGRLYRRVPLAVLEHQLATFVANRTSADTQVIERALAEVVAAMDVDTETSVPPDRAAAPPKVPRWMLDFARLLAEPLHTDNTPFMSTEVDGVYAASYGNADEITLSDLTGLDPAIFRR